MKKIKIYIKLIKIKTSKNLKNSRGKINNCDAATNFLFLSVNWILSQKGLRSSTENELKTDGRNEDGMNMTDDCEEEG